MKQIVEKRNLIPKSLRPANVLRKNHIDFLIKEKKNNVQAQSDIFNKKKATKTLTHPRGESCCFREYDNL